MISKKAKIGQDVSIGPYTVVHGNVIIGDNTSIGSNCVIGHPSKFSKGAPLKIGENSNIRSHNILYEGSNFGPNLTTGHSAFVRENCLVGKNVQIGSYSMIEGDCNIGDYVKIHLNVQMSKWTKIGDFVWIFPNVQITSDPFPPSNVYEGVTVKDMAVIATGAILLPGVTVGLGSFVAAGSIVKSDVPDVSCVTGAPATVFTTLDKFINLKYKLSYPWPKHFRTGYPKESFPRMEALVKKIEGLIDKTKNSNR